MPDFLTVPHPVFSPTMCLVCQTTTDPAGFVDTGLDLEAYGHIYLCSRCVVQAGHRFGMLDQAQAAMLERRADDESAEVQRLQAQVEFEREHKTISANDLQAWVERVTVDGRPAVGATIEAGLVCPDCGGPKGAASKRCRSCSIKATPSHQAKAEASA